MSPLLAVSKKKKHFRRLTTLVYIDAFTIFNVSELTVFAGEKLTKCFSRPLAKEVGYYCLRPGRTCSNHCSWAWVRPGIKEEEEKVCYASS